MLSQQHNTITSIHTYMYIYIYKNKIQTKLKTPTKKNGSENIPLSLTHHHHHRRACRCVRRATLLRRTAAASDPALRHRRQRDHIPDIGEALQRVHRQGPPPIRVRAQPRPGQEGAAAAVVGRQGRRLRRQLRGAAEARLRDRPLEAAAGGRLRGEHILVFRQGLDARRRREGVGRRGEVLQLRHEHVQGGGDVRPLHAAGVEQHREGGLRRRPLRHRRCIRHLQLLAAGELRGGEALLIFFKKNSFHFYLFIFPWIDLKFI